MRFDLNAADWPITLKVPLVVMALMLTISFFISNSVLSRLAETQERHLRTLSRSYLDGLGATLLPHILREDVWEVFDTLDRARSAHADLNAINTFVVNAANTVIAASDPKMFPTGQTLPAATGGPETSGGIAIDETAQTARMLRPVMLQGRRIGGIYTELDISALLAERRAVLWQLILTNAALTIFLMAVGYWAVRRMVQPVRTLGAYLDRGSDGPMEIIPDAQLNAATGEFARLFQRYNAMAKTANERLDLAKRLAREERLASLGRLASGMAHEINNPLGGMFNALAALKRYGDREPVREASISLLERGLNGIRDVVRAALMTYRKPDQRRLLTHADMEDLRHLIRPALRQRKLALDWANEIDQELPLSSHGVRDAALNLLLNACAASPEGATLSFSAGARGDRLEIAVSDRGSGLPEPYRRLLEEGDCASGPPRTGEGLGLWMVRRLLNEAGGAAHVELNDPGTTIRLNFPLLLEESRHVA